LLHELKLALCEGVKVFEELEQNTISQGRERLLRILHSIPSILEDFCNRLYADLGNVNFGSDIETQ
jgi:hypothetical protein